MWKFQGWRQKNDGNLTSKVRDFYNSLDFESEEIVPGWRVSMLKSEQRDAYLLTVISRVAGADGKRAVFASDERGVIYQGPVAPLAIPAQYVPIREGLPHLNPLRATPKTLLLARTTAFLRRVAYSGIREDVVPVQGACGCCSAGSCSSGQCYCVNCGYENCPFCCMSSCSQCWWGCAGWYCACCS